jgi:hypothetical protein
VPKRLSRSEQNQGQEQEEYINIREFPGTNGKLFIGDVANKQGIEGGGLTSRVLIPDGKGGYRPPTNKELDKIWEEIREEKNKKK